MKFNFLKNKKIFFIIIFYYQLESGMAQVLDSAYLEVSYNYIFVSDSTKPSIKSVDILILEAGKKYSKCYSLYKQIRDSLLTGQFNEQQLAGATRYSVDMRGFNKRGSPEKIFRKITSSKIIVTTDLIGYDYVYNDSISDMKWKIIGDTQTISNYLCTKATTSFRGRKYEAWFAQDIPLPYGPYKFGGLPGLILYLKEEKSNFIFECRSLSNLPNKIPIVYEQKKYLKANRKEVNRLFRLMIENPDAFVKSHGMEIIEKDCNGCPPPPPKPVFNPIEKY